MITAEFEEALVNQIASMTELEKVSLFDKLNPLLRKEHQEHIVVTENEDQLQRRVNELEDDFEMAEREKEAVEEKLERIKDALDDALKLPLSQLHNKIQEIINDL